MATFPDMTPPASHGAAQSAYPKTSKPVSPKRVSISNEAPIVASAPPAKLPPAPVSPVSVQQRVSIIEHPPSAPMSPRQASNPVIANPPVKTRAQAYQKSPKTATAPKKVAAQPAPTQSAEKLKKPAPLPIQTVEQRHKSEKKAAKSSKATLPIIYVDAPKPGEAAKKIQVPPGGAKVVFRGQEGQKVTMTKTAPPASQNGTVKVVRTTTSSLATTQPQVQVIKTGGASGQDQIILVQQQPQVVAYPYYGYRRYPYYGYPYYGWGWGYPYYW